MSDEPRLFERAPLEGRRVRITAKHIEAGEPGNCSFCPVALALSEILAKVSYVQVHPDFLVVDEWRYRTPEEVGIFMDRFDGDSETRENAHPFTFVMPAGDRMWNVPF